jgi:alpha-amylase/alpha-mannosidase (GH57 family)
VKQHGHEQPWHEVGGGQIDPTRPYRCFLTQDEDQNGDRRYIDVFFYDGPISRDMGFNDVLASSQHFAGRIGQAMRGDHRPHQLLPSPPMGKPLAITGAGGENPGLRRYPVLSPAGLDGDQLCPLPPLHPPTWEVELKPVTAWSCAHGVDRWQDDCGCGGGGSGTSAGGGPCAMRWTGCGMR